MPNLQNVTRYIAAGFQRFDFHQLDSGGLPAGITGVVTAGATGVAAGRIYAAKTLAITTAAGETLAITGDNVLQGNFQWQNVQPRAFDSTFAEDDFADRNAFQDIKTRNIGTHSFAGRDITPFNLNDLLMIGVSNAKAQTQGVLGQGMYAGVFAKGQMSVRGRDSFVERAAATFMSTVTLNNMDSYPWGETFSIGNEGYTQSFVEDWTLAYPVTCHRWTQSSGVTVFNLGETPASTSLNDVLVYVIDTNGIPTRKTTGVTIDATAKTLTFSPAPTDGYSIVAWYGYVPS